MTSTLWSFIAAHPTTATVAAWYIASAAIGSLPMPDTSSGKFYRWFFQFSNTLAANIARAWASKLPKDDAPKP